MKRCVIAFTLTSIFCLNAALQLARADETLRSQPVELLVNAAAQGDLAGVQRLLSAHTNPNAASKAVGLALPLVQAAANGHGGVISALLQAGALVDARDGRGQRAVVVAAYHGRLDVCRQLLKAGARIEPAPQSAPDDELSALLAAVFSGNHAIAELLAQAGAPVMHTDRVGRNALIAAARAGNGKIVVTLLDALAKEGHIGVPSRSLLLLAREEAAQAKHANVVNLIEQRNPQ